jgi:hypothetical protein
MKRSLSNIATPVVNRVPVARKKKVHPPCAIYRPDEKGELQFTGSVTRAPIRASYGK